VWIALAAFVGVGVLRLNLLWVLLALFPISLILNRPSPDQLGPDQLGPDQHDTDRDSS
jgi:hypothetical protein